MNFSIEVYASLCVTNGHVYILPYKLVREIKILSQLKNKKKNFSNGYNSLGVCSNAYLELLNWPILLLNLEVLNGKFVWKVR